jgi:hypothetical protein
MREGNPSGGATCPSRCDVNIALRIAISYRGVTVKNEKIISLRLPGDLLNELERERLRVSHAAGVDVNTSEIARSILRRALKTRSRRRSPRGPSHAA